MAPRLDHQDQRRDVPRAVVRLRNPHGLTCTTNGGNLDTRPSSIDPLTATAPAVGSASATSRGRSRSACIANARLGHAGEDRGGAGSGGENLLALLAQLALRPDVPVERHGGDPEVAAECGHRGVAVRHRGLG